MSRPLLSPPLSDSEVPLWNLYYQSTCPAPRDPTIVWGTEVDCTGLQSYLRRINAEADLLITPAHVLVRAAAQALRKHSQFNRRILRKRVRAYRDINIVMPFQKKVPPEADLLLFQQADRKSLAEIARESWQSSQAASRGEYVCVKQAVYMRWPRRILRLLSPLHVWLVNNINGGERLSNKRQRTASTMVNYLGFKGAPPLRSFKPSRYPYDSVTLSITMGGAERRAVVVGERVEPRPVAPVFVRADHRLVDAYEIGMFVATVRGFLADPATMDEPERETPPAPRPAHDVVGAG